MFWFVNIAEVWSRIEPVMRRLMKGAPEDVVAACRAGQAVCLSCQEGFVIVRIKVIDGERIMHVWWANTTTGKPESLIHHVEELAQMAADLKCRTLRFDTQRRGWLRRGPALGFHLIRFYGKESMEFGRYV